MSSRVRRTAGLEGAGADDSEGKDEDSAATGTAGGTSDAVKESAAIDEDTKWNNNEQRRSRNKKLSQGKQGKGRGEKREKEATTTTTRPSP